MRKSLALAAIMAALPLAAGAATGPEVVLGVFEGALPCADCPGIRTRLTLVQENRFTAEGRYRLEETYLDRDAAPRVSEGTWTTLRGDAVDPDAVVYELNPDEPARAREFLKVGERAIRQLDRDFKEIPSRANYTLKRIRTPK